MVWLVLGLGCVCLRMNLFQVTKSAMSTSPGMSGQPRMMTTSGQPRMPGPVGGGQTRMIMSTARPQHHMRPQSAVKRPPGMDQSPQASLRPPQQHQQQQQQQQQQQLTYQQQQQYNQHQQNQKQKQLQIQQKQHQQFVQQQQQQNQQHLIQQQQQQQKLDQQQKQQQQNFIRQPQKQQQQQQLMQQQQLKQHQQNQQQNQQQQMLQPSVGGGSMSPDSSGQFSPLTGGHLSPGVSGPFSPVSSWQHGHMSSGQMSEVTSGSCDNGTDTRGQMMTSSSGQVVSQEGHVSMAMANVEHNYGTSQEGGGGGDPQVTSTRGRGQKASRPRKPSRGRGAKAPTGQDGDARTPPKKSRKSPGRGRGQKGAQEEGGKCAGRGRGERGGRGGRGKQRGRGRGGRGRGQGAAEAEAGMAGVMSPQHHQNDEEAERGQYQTSLATAAPAYTTATQQTPEGATPHMQHPHTVTSSGHVSTQAAGVKQPCAVVSPTGGATASPRQQQPNQPTSPHFSTLKNNAMRPPQPNQQSLVQRAGVQGTGHSGTVLVQIQRSGPQTSVQSPPVQRPRLTDSNRVCLRPRIICRAKDVLANPNSNTQNKQQQVRPATTSLLRQQLVPMSSQQHLNNNTSSVGMATVNAQPLSVTSPKLVCSSPVGMATNKLVSAIQTPPQGLLQSGGKVMATPVTGGTKIISTPDSRTIVRVRGKTPQSLVIMNSGQEVTGRPGVLRMPVTLASVSSPRTRGVRPSVVRGLTLPSPVKTIVTLGQRPVKSPGQAIMNPRTLITATTVSPRPVGQATIIPRYGLVTSAVRGSVPVIQGQTVASVVTGPRFVVNPMGTPVRVSTATHTTPVTPNTTQAAMMTSASTTPVTSDPTHSHLTSQGQLEDDLGAEEDSYSEHSGESEDSFDHMEAEARGQEVKPCRFTLSQGTCNKQFDVDLNSFAPGEIIDFEMPNNNVISMVYNGDRLEIYKPQPPGKMLILKCLVLFENMRDHLSVLRYQDICKNVNLLAGWR